MASAKASARKNDRKASQNSNVPRGMRLLEGGYAKTWNVDELPELSGTVSNPPKSVTLNAGTKKETVRECVEVRTEDGERYTLWHSAALTPLFERLGEITDKKPLRIWVAFKGLGVAKKGQNAPKLFDVAVSD